jgi:hypothetical protein
MNNSTETNENTISENLDISLKLKVGTSDSSLFEEIVCSSMVEMIALCIQWQDKLSKFEGSFVEMWVEDINSLFICNQGEFIQQELN